MLLDLCRCFFHQMSLQSRPRHSVVAFDFDHTVVDDNTDTVIWRLAENGALPARITERRQHLPWTQFVQVVLDYLHEIGRSADDILDYIASIPLTPGILQLLSAVRDENVTAIIVSDSNTLFIQRILDKHGLSDHFQRIFTNPAHLHSSRIVVEPYENQTGCSICSQNMCKGGVLRRYLADEHWDSPSSRPRLVYVGDGRNDWCAALQLGSEDLVCPRSGYKLDGLIRDQAEKIRAQVIPWQRADSLISDVLER